MNIGLNFACRPTNRWAPNKNSRRPFCTGCLTPFLLVLSLLLLLIFFPLLLVTTAQWHRPCREGGWKTTFLQHWQFSGSMLAWDMDLTVKSSFWLVKINISLLVGQTSFINVSFGEWAYYMYLVYMLLVFLYVGWLNHVIPLFFAANPCTGEISRCQTVRPSLMEKGGPSMYPLVN
jgi:hypothetical protein